MSESDYSKAFGSGVVAFSSDRLIDFHKGNPDHPERFVLTGSQREWLLARGLHNPDGVIFPKQVHGDTIWRVTSTDAGLRGCLEADAVVTSEAGVPISVRTADCLPLLLFDPVAKVVAAVHAGWKGAKLGIAAKTVSVMHDDYGVRPAALFAVIGPCIRRDSYQVGVEFRKYFPEDVEENPLGLRLDLAAANVRQLLAAGVNREHIYDCARDTFSDHRLHSFRRDAEAAGRMINVIMVAG